MRTIRFTHVVVSLTLGIALISLPGCASQLDALAPVGGDDLSMVRTAATTVLLANDLELLEAPQCRKSETEIVCQGSLVDGSEVSVQAPTDPFKELTVRVENEVLFQGDLKQVIDAAARGELP